jgi:hypothetical protein
LVLRPTTTRSTTQSIYAFFEGYSKYDLHVQMAIKSSSSIVYEFLEGATSKKSACYNDLA